MRRAGPDHGGECSCVKLGERGGFVDALTAAGVRGTVPSERFDTLWTTGPKKRRVSVARAHSTGDTNDAWLDRGSPQRVELWPWHGMDVVAARMAVLGLTLGAPLTSKRYGPPEHSAVMTTYAVVGTYREPPAFEVCP